MLEDSCRFQVLRCRGLWILEGCSPSLTKRTDCCPEPVVQAASADAFVAHAYSVVTFEEAVSETEPSNCRSRHPLKRSGLDVWHMAAGYLHRCNSVGKGHRSLSIYASVELSSYLSIYVSPRCTTS